MSNRVQMTAWGSEEDKAMLEEIVKKRGFRSMSEALLMAIAEMHERLDADSGEQDEFANIYKVMALISQGKVFHDADSIKLFLKGGSK